ncbi:MAG: hypothetical protein JWR26_1962 [Pedosphaera sp.]|nr:hypothetical protein [Pedosphaera sp.]
MRRIIFVMFLWLLACSVARPDVVPIPESEQAAKALKIIDAYHHPRSADAPRKLRIVYFTPGDRDPAPAYQQRLDAIMEDIRGFYRDGMERLGFGPKTFTLERDASGGLIIHLVKGKSPDSSFPSWKERPGTGDPTKGGGMVLDECRPALKADGISLDRETVLIFCNLANWDEKAKTFSHHSPYFGSWDSTSGLCYAADSVVLNLDDIPRKKPVLNDQEYGYMSLGKFNTIFIGGIAHELGHAFALPHCGERSDEKALGTSIMGIGNHAYREERRGEGKGSFLTMASAMRLASHPLFNGSIKGLGEEPRLQQCQLILTTNVTQTGLVGGRGGLRLEGTVEGSPPIYGVVAYFDSAHDGGYRAPTATSVPDADGRFAIEVGDLASCASGELRVEFCHVNGAVSERRLGFTVTPEGSVDVSQWEMRQALQPVADAVVSEKPDAALTALALLEKKQTPELDKLIARKLVASLEQKARLSPANVPPEVAQFFLGDGQPEDAKVGWLTPAANRIPLNQEIESPLLDSGTVFATSLFAHSPSRYVFDLGGKWKTLRGKAGLHTAFQSRAFGIVFVIKADGREVFRSATIRGTENPSYEIDVAGVKTLEFIVDKANERNGGNWGLWLDPVLNR